ncbi:hypothetical protein PMN64_28325 [Bradyrhizobium sp. UFLA01-814]|uniref:hypothetical protein n=1 Tax=Bradyrhizobium sp. UFLA01-814 TaxID=3023480 RepID=UPI00398AC3FD
MSRVDLGQFRSWRAPDLLEPPFEGVALEADLLHVAGDGADVDAAEARQMEEGGGLGLTQHELQLARLECRIGCHKDHASERAIALGK